MNLQYPIVVFGFHFLLMLVLEIYIRHISHGISSCKSFCIIAAKLFYRQNKINQILSCVQDNAGKI